jgi:hypothetical protein
MKNASRVSVHEVRRWESVQSLVSASSGKGLALNGIVLYLLIAVMASIAAFLFSEWLRRPGAPAPDHPGLVAALAGLLWPVLAVGLAQWALVAALHRQVRSEAVAVRPARDDVRV